MNRADSDEAWPRRRALRRVIAIIALMACVSCAAPQKDIAMSAETAASSVHSAQLVMETLDDEHLTATAAEVAVTEALAELASAQSQLDAVAVTTAAQTRSQARTTTAIADAIAAVQAAQQSLEGFSGAPSRSQALAAVKRAAKQLDAVVEKAGRPR